MTNQNSFLKKVVFSVTFNIALGFLFLLFITPNIPFASSGDTIMFYKYWFFASGVMGLTSMIYEFERISTLSASILHFISTALIIAVTSKMTVQFIPNYNPNILNIIIGSCIIVAIIFVICWVLAIIYEKMEAKKINEKLNKK